MPLQNKNMGYYVACPYGSDVKQKNFFLPRNNLTVKNPHPLPNVILTLLALFWNFLLLLSHKVTANAGPNSARRLKITPLRAGVIRANKVLRTGVERSMSNIVEIYRRIRNISPGLKAKCGGLIFRGDYIREEGYIQEENCVSEAYIGQNLGW